MIKYAGAPQLGDYVIINNSNNYVRLVTSVIANINKPIVYRLDNGEADWEKEELTRIKPNWNVGELVRYKGRVHQILIIEVKDYKFVYSLEDINQWIAEDELEYVNDIQKSVSYGSCIKINKYCEVDDLRGREGKIDVAKYLVAHCLLDSYGPCCLRWEIIDVIEEKVELYNAELICIEGDRSWKEGELAKVINGVLYYKSNEMNWRQHYGKFNNIEDVNNLFTARFAEIKEIIGDKVSWNGKFYVVDTTAGSPVKVGNMYVVREGILNVGGYSFTQRFTSFKEIQERFDYATLIEVKE